MRIEILGAESPGVRGLCCLVETKSRKVVIDPGVALGYRRLGLLPHPIQVAVAERVEVAIEKALEDATDVMISHYHGEHHPMVDANPYQLSADRVAESLMHSGLWSKGIQNIAPAQIHRARALAQRVGRDFSAAEGLSKVCLSFSLLFLTVNKAGHFSVPQSQVGILTGFRSRNKVVEVAER